MSCRRDMSATCPRHVQLRLWLSQISCPRVVAPVVPTLARSVAPPIIGKLTVPIVAALIVV
eukprot:scaffold28355_cov23-Cyclotella_meneghiniana.AAC.1